MYVLVAGPGGEGEARGQSPPLPQTSGANVNVSVLALLVLAFLLTNVRENTTLDLKEVTWFLPEILNLFSSPYDTIYNKAIRA